MIGDYLPPAWVADAVCASVDPSLWFPEKGQGASVPTARAICRTCPVTEQCLDYALTLDVAPDGIWGGTTYRERRVLRHQRGIVELKPCGTRAAYLRHVKAGDEPCRDCVEANRAYHRAYDEKRGAA